VPADGGAVGVHGAADVGPVGLCGGASLANKGLGCAQAGPNILPTLQVPVPYIVRQYDIRTYDR
jgi:hypothetical protein